MPKNVSLLVMTFVDDEIEQINAKKLKEFTSGAKNHKTENPVVKPTPRPFPPVLLINSIISQVYEASFPLITDPSKGLESIVPVPVKAQPLLDTIVKLHIENNKQAGKELAEAQIKIFATNLQNETREIGYFGLIALYKASVNDEEDWYTYITPKGIIYANMLNYLASGDPREHYAIYLQVANS